MRVLRQFLEIIIATTILSVAGYYTIPQFKIAIDQKIEWLFPCKNILTYSIGTLDKSFGISKSEFLDIIRTAEKPWEDASGKELFSYEETQGKVLINLIYDDRQSSTDKLKKLGYVINDDKASYDSLKTKYDSLKKSFDRDKAVLENDIRKLKQEQVEFEKEVKYWNDRGGAPTNEYNKLSRWKEDLNIKIRNINENQNKLNQSVDTINSLSTVLNELISTLNLDVQKYNNNQGSLGEEFDQGEYVLDTNGRHIDIYQFDNKDKLARVLTHELGHALGLQHNDNPKSVMYKLNQGSTLKLSTEDISSLKSVCNL